MPNRVVRILIALGIIVASCGAAFGQAEPLHGTVIGKSEKGIQGVRVVLRPPGSEEIIDEQVTDAEGRFSIAMEHLRPGHEIHLEKDGYEPATVPVSPQQLVIANIRVTMLRTRVAPAESPTPEATPTAVPDPSWLGTTEKEREQAIKIYNEAVKMWEKAETPEQKDMALRMIRQAASIDPEFPEPLRILSKIAMERQNWAEASRHSEALIRIDPNDEQAIKNLYASLVITRHFKRVGEAAKRLVSIDPENISYVEHHAQEFFKNNQFEMARAFYQALTEVAPDAPNAYLNLGICCASLGDVEGMRAAYEKFLELAPPDHQDVEAVQNDLAALDAPKAPE
jgi:tetratricopeptide (TPR) repeat protein